MTSDIEGYLYLRMRDEMSHQRRSFIDYLNCANDRIVSNITMNLDGE